MQRQARRLAAEYGIDFDELLAGCKRIAVEYWRLWAQGLPTSEFNRRLAAWIAADLGVDADELAVEWERERRRLRCRRD